MKSNIKTWTLALFVTVFFIDFNERLYPCILDQKNTGKCLMSDPWKTWSSLTA